MAPIQVTNTPADSAIQASVRTPDKDKLKQLGMRMQQMFLEYERDRRIAELRWAKNARQFLGQYDPDIERALEKSRSSAYPKLTRVKCVSMLSRLMNLLFPTSEKNWSIDCSKVPNLSVEDMQMVLNAIGANSDPEMPIEDKMIEMAIVEFAKARSTNMELEIEDQLQELGGDRQVDYVALCRKVLMSGIIYGMGVLKGPFARIQKQRTWARDAQGLLVPQVVEAYRPQFEFTSIWDYYPDMSAKYLHQMDGQFQRIVMSRHQIRELADRPDFFSDTITGYLRDHPKGNYKRRTYEAEIKAMGAQVAVNDQDGRKYEIIVWDGYISGHEMAAAGFEIDEGQLHEQTEAIVWTLDGEVIKCDISPWVQLDVNFKVNTYHHFIFEEDESTLTGNGLPNIMRDSQMAVSSSARMLLDNASITCGPQLEINTALLRQDQDLVSVHAYKVWYREDMGVDASAQAVRNITIDSHMTELMKVIDLFQAFADTETFVGPATGGDMQKGPSEPFRTATGASLLRGDAALPFKDVVRNYDGFTQSVISSIVAFNTQFNTKKTIIGDHQVIPRGATSLIAKEVRGMILDNLAQSLTPEDARYLNRWQLLRERLAARDVDVEGGILCDKEEAKRRDEVASKQASDKQAQIDEIMRAEVRKLLAEGVKALTQSDKNAAAADATVAKAQIEIANQMLGQLEGAIDANGTGNTGEPTPSSAGKSAGTGQQQGRGDGAGAPSAPKPSSGEGARKA
jgi:hypothetical protein